MSLILTNHSFREMVNLTIFLIGWSSVVTSASIAQPPPRVGDDIAWSDELDHVYVCAQSANAANAADAAKAVASDDEVTSLRVMSFNLRYGSAKDGENHWDKRKALVAETIGAFRPDLLGVQETLGFQAEFLGEQFPDFTYVGRSRDSNPVGGEQCGILFRSDRFYKLIEGHFWLSPTPDQPGSKGWDSAYPRMATWVKLWDRDHRRSLYVLNTHFDHVGETARAESAKLIHYFLYQLPDDSSVIVTGDFNAGEGSAPYNTLFSTTDPKSSLVDTFRIHFPTRGQNEGTFNGFKGKETGDRIDWIGASKNFETQTAAIDKTSRDGHYPSDHFPVTAVLDFAHAK